MNYEQGKQYEMRVVDIRVDSAGYDYIALHDDDPSKEYRVYNILKCQYDSLPETLYVKVKSVDMFGKIKFRQDEERLFKEHYKVGGFYSFRVTDVREDSNTKAEYYVIEDDFAAHRYYFRGEKKYNLGDNCILEVAGFDGKGFLKLKEVKHHVNAPQIEHAIDSELFQDDDQPRTKEWESLPTLDVGEESETIEFKSSIAFPPENNHEANIDKQIRNIIKALVAFMNTDGGTLYIGIHDKTKKITGIEDDFEHLNDSQNDDYTYQQNVDGYQLKIRNTMERICTGVAGSMVHFTFKTEQGKTYCQIKVDSAARPVYIDGSRLYVRQGNRNKLLKDDEITLFVYNKMSISVKEIIDTDDLELNNNAYADLNKLEELLRKLVNTKNSALIPTELLPKKTLGEIEIWIVWYNDGTWVKQRNKSDDNDVCIQVPVPKVMMDQRLVLCYDSGNVTTITVRNFLSGARMNVRQKKSGWARNSLHPKDIFVMHETDFLVGYSIDSDGIEHVKLHYISDYRLAAGVTGEGGVFIPKDSQVLKYAVLGAEHKRKIEHLIVAKNRRSNDPGPALTSPTIQNEIEYLKQVLEQ